MASLVLLALRLSHSLSVGQAQQGQFEQQAVQIIVPNAAFQTRTEPSGGGFDEVLGSFEHRFFRRG